MAAMKVDPIRELARSGELRAASEQARKALARLGPAGRESEHAELHLVAAFCAMRQGNHADAHRELEAASQAASSPGAPRVLALRVAAWRAELAYFQGRYSDANGSLDSLVRQLERAGDRAYAAFALRTRMAILLARADYDGIDAIAPRARRLARASGDPYVLVQVLNLLGAVHFDRATSKLQQHARAHLPALDPQDAATMQEDASRALAFFEQAHDAARDAGYHFAAWYVSGNIERLEILLGRAGRAVPAIRKRLRALQSRGAKYDEIVTRSNLAWALRTLGRHRDALHELDVALDLARATSTFNVLLEFIHYDRSVVLDALGQAAAARASYRRYHRLAGPFGVDGASGRGAGPGTQVKRPLEPAFLKRFDRYVGEHLAEPLAVGELARQCGVSWKTLERAFGEFRGLMPVAHIRNLRLDAARRALDGGGVGVADVASRFGFGSPTTFSLEYRKRFGVPPSRTKRRAARAV